MITPAKILVATVLFQALGCQAPSATLRPEDAETGGPVAAVTIARKATPFNDDHFAIWQHVPLNQSSSAGTLRFQPPINEGYDDLRISAPGYVDSFIHLDWKEMTFSFPPQTDQFSFNPTRLPVWLKPVKSLFPNETITQMNQDWAFVLANVVTPDGSVRWDLLQKNQAGVRDHLSSFINNLARISPDNRPELFPYVKQARDHAQRVAYWINAYNALSMNWVVEHGYPDTIPKERPDRFIIGGKLMSFEDVEKQTVYGDSAIHLFAINFCARSCAPLRSTPYDGAGLDRQLADQARAYLRDPRAAARVGDTLKVNDLIFSHRREFPTHVQMQSKRAKHAADMLRGLAYYAGRDDTMFEGYIEVAPLGFDWSLNRPK